MRECIELATQAPTGGNNQGWHFVVVTDAEKRRQLGDWYAQGFAMMYGNPDAVVANLPKPTIPPTWRPPSGSSARRSTWPTTWREVPVHVIPVIEGRTDNNAPVAHAGRRSGARSSRPRGASSSPPGPAGLGTCFTTLHLIFEQQAAELLGLPAHVMQGALIPVAHTLGGTDFKPGPRRDLDRIIHHDGW